MNKSQVWFLPWAKRQDLKPFLKAAGFCSFLGKNDSLAIKTHFGEKGNSGYVKREFFRPILELASEAQTRPFLTDTNTIYRGSRSNAKDHLNIASQHGFGDIGVPVIIADGDFGEKYIDTAVNGNHFKKVKIAFAIASSDSILVVSHFKGHILFGFGGAIKNLGMGCSARIGKYEMHSQTAPSVSIKKCTGCGECTSVCVEGALKMVNDKITLSADKCAGCGECLIVCKTGALNIRWSESWKKVQEKCVEYALGAVKDKKIFCVTFINHVTENCDCISVDEKPLIDDVGILASLDPAAIDQAAVDLVRQAAGFDLFKKIHPDVDCEVQLAYAEKMGLGTRSYELIRIA